MLPFPECVCPRQVLLCHSHHRLVHESGSGLQASSKGVVGFRLPDGKKNPRGPDMRFRGNVVAIKSANRKKGLNITPNTAIPDWYGNRLDPEMSVGMLLVCE